MVSGGFKRNRARLAVVGSSAALLAALALIVPGALAGGDSLKLTMPAQGKVGKRFAIKLSGFTSHRHALITVVSDRQKCRRTADAEFRLQDLTSWVTGVIVHGHLTYVDRIRFAPSTHGSRHFCAYVLFFPGTSATSVTTARAARRSRIG